MTKERPILFSAAMVKAIIEGRKTMTRRVVKCSRALDTCGLMPLEPDVEKCPYGQPGDRLWVRETWAAVRFSEDDVRESHDIPPAKTDYWTTAYKADVVYEENRDDRGFAWRPSIHMPRWASRITLEVTAVRVERLQEITEADARAEGIALEPCSAGHHMRYGLWTGKKHACNDSAKVVYMDLWEAINAERGFGWDVNPWVFVIEFKRIGDAQ